MFATADVPVGGRVRFGQTYIYTPIIISNVVVLDFGALDVLASEAKVEIYTDVFRLFGPHKPLSCEFLCEVLHFAKISPCSSIRFVRKLFLIGDYDNYILWQTGRSIKHNVHI